MFDFEDMYFELVGELYFWKEVGFLLIWSIERRGYVNDLKERMDINNKLCEDFSLRIFDVLLVVEGVDVDVFYNSNIEFKEVDIVENFFVLSKDNVL